MKRPPENPGQFPGDGVPETAPATGGAPVLRVDRLCRHFKVNHTVLPVLENISFSAKPGEFIAVLGPSGCGKSTLLKLVAGFMPPSSGRILVRGNPVSGPGPERCMVFQEDALFPWLTVGENTAFGLKPLGLKASEIRGRVDRILDRVGLAPFRDYLPQEISGGMKQRVALARVLVLGPGILLMDEPFAALDAQTRERMQALLLDLWQGFSQTILFVTHDVREAVSLADRILVMDTSPGRVRRQVGVDLDRPRAADDPGFLTLCRDLSVLIQN